MTKLGRRARKRRAMQREASCNAAIDRYPLHVTVDGPTKPRKLLFTWDLDADFMAELLSLHKTQGPS